MSLLSRRSLVSIAASLPALAVPALAASTAVADTALAMPSQPRNGPTAIDLLWEQRQATRREYSTATRRYDRLKAELTRRMPKAHPSITYSKENDADGLEFCLPDHKPHSLHSYIRSKEIESAIDEIDQSCAGYEYVGGELVLYPDRKRPLTEQEIERRARLVARLERSREYEKMKDQIDRKIGLTKLNLRIENQILPRLNKIDSRIYSAPAVTQSDLKRKLAIYEADEACEYTAERLLRDFRRLVKRLPLPAAA
jgi:hypothetical protein